MLPPKHYETSKNWFGSRSVKYACSHCGERLRSPLRDAGKEDVCPACFNRFVVPGADELERVSAAQKAAKEWAARAKAEQAEARRLQNLRRKAEQIKAKEEAEAEKAERRRLAVETQKVHAEEAESTKQEADTEKLPKKRLPWRGCGAVVLVGLLITSYFAIRGSDLRSKLDRCETNGIVKVRVSYAGLFSTDTVVFDLRDGGSYSARRIDPVHLLMQFADKLDLYSVDRVVLSKNGRHRFYITGYDLRALADSYAGGGRLWAFNNLPANVRRMDGTRAFGEWSGGWLGVLKEQTEDLNEFIRQWTGY